jgi:hypothetical protein
MSQRSPLRGVPSVSGKQEPPDYSAHVRAVAEAAPVPSKEKARELALLLMPALMAQAVASQQMSAVRKLAA